MRIKSVKPYLQMVISFYFQQTNGATAIRLSDAVFRSNGDRQNMDRKAKRKKLNLLRVSAADQYKALI